jgi:hypothetical protein
MIHCRLYCNPFSEEHLIFELAAIFLYSARKSPKSILDDTRNFLSRNPVKISIQTPELPSPSRSHHFPGFEVLALRRPNALKIASMTEAVFPFANSQAVQHPFLTLRDETAATFPRIKVLTAASLRPSFFIP